MKDWLLLFTLLFLMFIWGMAYMLETVENRCATEGQVSNIKCEIIDNEKTE